MPVADHQPVTVHLIDLVGELLHIGGHLGLQRRLKHLAGTVADDLIQQQPTRSHLLVRGIRVVNYREQGRTFPTSAPMPVLIEYLIP